MPLNTQIIRDGETLNVEGGWSYYHLSCMFTAATKDIAPEIAFDDTTDPENPKTFGDLNTEQGEYVDFSMVPIYYLGWPIPLLERGEQTLIEDYPFKGFELRRGDILKAWRD